MSKLWIWKILCLIALCLVTIPSVRAQAAFPTDSDYVLLDFYQHHQSDSLRLGQAFGFTRGWALGKHGFVYEWQRPLIPFVRFRGRINKDRVAATALVMGLAIGIEGWAMHLSGYSDEKITKWATYVLAPFGSHLGYRPARWVIVYAGLIPDVMLFTEDKGILAEGRAGIRLDAKLGLVANVGYMKPLFWGVGSASRVFPGGLYIGLSYASPMGSWLLD